ncbi:hypothetical protein FGO68_gene6663 [Halteria grandinella]|uniref:Uncharacterized protein n=1 Tax=Halteria grandinella TaxID=5974 RepID=A0A8J8P086_HALGN|nr:hypothetical protein FGO68_gene6663 [Halteria grandinella]
MDQITLSQQNLQDDTLVLDEHRQNQFISFSDDDRIKVEGLFSGNRLQTRRQSKGLTYFDRLKPRVSISVGDLEDWHKQRYGQEQQRKRRRLNKTVDDIEEVLSEDSSEEEVYIELNRTVADAEESKVNKSLLHENWIEEFEKQKKKVNNKKRKRNSSSSSKSRSPTPVSKQNLQFDQQVNKRKASVKHQDVVSNSRSVQSSVKESSLDSEEETRRELEKIKRDIVKMLAAKDEPQSIAQISIFTKYLKTVCDEALVLLVGEKKVKRKDFGKNNQLFYLSQSPEDPSVKEEVKQRVRQLIQIEREEISKDQEQAHLEKELKEIKQLPTTLDVNNRILAIRTEMESLRQQLALFKQSEEYVGDQGIARNISLRRQLVKAKEVLVKRREGCIDMVEVLSEQLNEPIAKILRKAIIDMDEFSDTQAFEILGIKLEEKKKEDSEMNEDNIDGEEEEEEGEEEQEEEQDESPSKNVNNDQ